MEKFNFMKLGILLAMMLVGSMALVGSASAHIIEPSENGYFKVCADGILWSSTHAYYWGFAEKYDPPVAGKMELTVGIYNQGHYWMTGKYIEGYDCDRVEEDGIYNNAMALVSPYTQTDFVAQDPLDYKYELRYYLYPE